DYSGAACQQKPFKNAYKEDKFFCQSFIHFINSVSGAWFYICAIVSIQDWQSKNFISGTLF
ncbi:MAG TPA: hypothetical protein VH878_04290, partial [Thermodesulfobacteriota bacterium]